MKKLFLFALAAASLSACKKDSDNTPSRTELLTSRKWRITAFTVNTTSSIVGGTPSSMTIDQYALQLACEKDDFYQFNTDKTMKQEEGPTQCSTSPTQTTVFNWDFNSDQSKLILTLRGSSSPTLDDIVELSPTTMRLRETTSSTSGNSTLNRELNITFSAF